MGGRCWFYTGCRPHPLRGRRPPRTELLTNWQEATRAPAGVRARRQDGQPALHRRPAAGAAPVGRPLPADGPGRAAPSTSPAATRPPQRWTRYRPPGFLHPPPGRGVRSSGARWNRCLGRLPAQLSPDARRSAAVGAPGTPASSVTTSAANDAGRARPRYDRSTSRRPFSTGHLTPSSRRGVSGRKGGRRKVKTSAAIRGRNQRRPTCSRRRQRCPANPSRGSFGVALQHNAGDAHNTGNRFPATASGDPFRSATAGLGDWDMRFGGGRGGSLTARATAMRIAG